MPNNVQLLCLNNFISSSKHSYGECLNITLRENWCEYWGPGRLSYSRKVIQSESVGLALNSRLFVLEVVTFNQDALKCQREKSGSLSVSLLAGDSEDSRLLELGDTCLCNSLGTSPSSDSTPSGYFLLSFGSPNRLLYREKKTLTNQ